MLGLFVFGTFFIISLILTFFLPFFPPGQIVIDFLRNSETDYYIIGIPGELLVSGIINGMVWGVFTVIVYSYFKGPSKEKVNLPIWIPGYTTSNNSKIGKKQIKKSVLTFRKNIKNQDIEIVDGIGIIYGNRFRKIGIKTIEDLIKVGYSKGGQNYLAKKIGVLPSTIRNWIYQAEAFN
jgi:hypothetical protein